MNDIEETLEERGTRYGDFSENARLAQELKDAIQMEDNWVDLDPVFKEALEFIMQKISRVLNGDPTYEDNWHDIAGYAKLAEDRCALIRSKTSRVTVADRGCC